MAHVLGHAGRWRPSFTRTAVPDGAVSGDPAVTRAPRTGGLRSWAPWRRGARRGSRAAQMFPAPWPAQRGGARKRERSRDCVPVLSPLRTGDSWVPPANSPASTAPGRSHVKLGIPQRGHSSKAGSRHSGVSTKTRYCEQASGTGTAGGCPIDGDVLAWCAARNMDQTRPLGVGLMGPGPVGVCGRAGERRGRGGESRSGGNVLVTGVDTIPTEKDCLHPRTGSQESHYPDVRGGEAFVRGLC